MALEPHEKWALDELVEMLIDDETGCSGQRNDDAVRMSIVCAILNLDLDEIVDKMQNNFRRPLDQRSPRWAADWKEHLERVKPYVEQWVPLENPAQGIHYYIHR